MIRNVEVGADTLGIRSDLVRFEAHLVEEFVAEPQPLLLVGCLKEFEAKDSVDD